MPQRVSLVNLQKLTFQAWLDDAEHVDVGARTEHASACALRDDDRPHLRVLEANALQRVAQLDVHAQVVRVGV